MAGIGIGLAASGVSGLSLGGSMLGFALGLVLMLPGHALGATGAGDVKLMAAVGAMVGADKWLLLFVVIAILGGVIAMALIIRTGRLRRTLWNVGYLLGELFRFRAPYVGREELDVKSKKAVKLPHGVAIAGGTLITLALMHFGILPQ